MNIYEEAARRYGGGVFRFPDCPECGGGYLSVRHVSSFSRAAPSGYHCDNCKHRWPKLTHRQMAQALWVELQRLTAVDTPEPTGRTYYGQHCTGQDDCPFCKQDRGEL